MDALTDSRKRLARSHANCTSAMTFLLGLEPRKADAADPCFR
jgi:hypothetical protein